MVKCCNGPCSQGDKVCPTPEACELDERYITERIKERWTDFALAVGIVLACIAYVVLMGDTWGIV